MKEKKMANKKTWLGMAAMVLTFGMVLAGCSEPQEVTGSVSINYPQLGDMKNYKITEINTKGWIIV